MRRLTRSVAPFGQEELRDLQSIFEVEQFRQHIILLDIQCARDRASVHGIPLTLMIDRMPALIGDFISRMVYDNRLRSYHSNHSHSACQFIDVVGSQELRSGESYWVSRTLFQLCKVQLNPPIFQNQREMRTIVNIARALAEKRRTYRVITPYDAQRGRIEQALKAENLNWEDRCFNVDSFQGTLQFLRVS